VKAASLELVEKREGYNEQAFEEMFKVFFERLCFYAITILKDDEVAREAVQFVFCKLWEKRDDKKAKREVV
jgi:RNA polymerase sigma-70 factor (ECF subfamily)